MSTIATGREAGLPAPPSWLRVIGAVIGGTLFAWASLFVILLPFAELGFVPVTVDGTSGQGWPWRIDDAWSLAADIGPLLVFGAVFAAGVEAFTGGWTGVRGRRLPIAVVAAAVGWIPVNGEREGLLAVSGLAGFLAVLWVARQYSVVERRRIRWTRPRVALIAAGVLALAAVSLSYGTLHPLTAGGPDRIAPGEFGFWLRNEGRGPVRVRSIEIADPRVTRARLAPGGATIPRDDSRLVHLTGRCAPLDRVVVRLHVAGHDVTQTVHLEQPASFSC
jgi:hypothetical protein